MNRSLVSQIRIPAAALAALVLASCAAAPSREQFQRQIMLNPAAAPTRVDGTARIDASADMSAELRDFWTAGMRNVEPARTNNYLAMLSNSLSQAVERANLFTRIDADGTGRPDFLVHIRLDYALGATSPSGGREIIVKLAFEVVDASTGKTISVNSAEGGLGVECVGNNGLRYNKQRYGMAPAYSVMMRGTITVVNAMLPRIEAGVAAAIADYRLIPAREKALADLKLAPLVDLLVSSDSSVAMARERNRCIVAAKVGQLPGMLRSWSSAKLTDLVVKLEQTILDLNHEAEVANDGAQRAAASEGNPARIDALRGLAISYRERVELLKPILASVKEELANRSR